MIERVTRELPSDVELPKVEIHATDLCNNRCSFCTTGWLMRAEAASAGLGHPPRELVRAKLEEAYSRGARRALFQGGEPTLRRDLGELVRDAYELGYLATTVFTNGRMAASRAGARWLAGMNVTWFQLSIQGGNARAHDASVGATGAFEQTIAGARRLLELGQRVKINAVLTTHLLDSLDDLASLMLSLGPEEVGLDTVKPSAAFEASRESYARLVPPLSRHREPLVRAMLRMDRGGLVARLTSFPPCLAPGAEHLVSEEAATTESQQTSGALVHKLAWKRSLQVKAPSCAACVYDATCGGVYAPYAALYGTDELAPVTERPRPPAPRLDAAPDTAFTRQLRRLLVQPSARAHYGVRSVRRLVTEAHELACFGPEGEAVLFVSPRDDAPAYEHTERFSLRYRADPSGARPDPRLMRDVAARLRRAEALSRGRHGRAPQGHEPPGADGS